ncbi:TPM domain-containing protein [Candidatus Acetothermia bacterium]|nr:TPM domain-containing protein [Candidatus Acetothermia bacterium]
MLNDYANILDHHRRRALLSLIEEARERFAIDVYLLFSWEDPFADIDRFADAILDFWNLERRDVLLGVFVRYGRRWEGRIVAGKSLVRRYPLLASTVEEEITFFIRHHEVARAAEELFTQITAFFALPPVVAPPVNEDRPTRVWIIFVIVGTTLLLLFIIRRICPRCIMILVRRRSTPSALPQREKVIYYCRRCGYIRIRRREG